MPVLEQAALSIPIAQSDEQVVSESTGTEDWVLATVVLVGAVGGLEEVDSSRDPKALVEKLGPTGVTFTVRFWHGPKTKDMWNARSAGAIAIKSALEKAGIQAPTPHQAVWIQQGSEQLKGQT
jgi:small-conductance mechanosensitive channel